MNVHTAKLSTRVETSKAIQWVKLLKGLAKSYLASALFCLSFEIVFLIIGFICLCRGRLRDLVKQ